MLLFKLCNALWIIVKAPHYKLVTLLALFTLLTLLPPSPISFWHEIKYSYYALASQNCQWTLLKVMKLMILDDIKSLEYDMNFQSCWRWDLSLLLSAWFFTLPSLVYFAPTVDVHLVIFSVNHPWKHLEANVRGLRCVTLHWIFFLLTLCMCSFWILSTQYIRYCKIPLTGVWQSHLGDGKTFQLKTVKIWPHGINTFLCDKMFVSEKW